MHRSCVCNSEDVQTGIGDTNTIWIHFTLVTTIIQVPEMLIMKGSNYEWCSTSIQWTYALFEESVPIGALSSVDIQTVNQNKLCSGKEFNFFFFFVYNDSQAGHSGQLQTHWTNNLNRWPYTPIAPVTLFLLQILITFLQSYTVPFEWCNYKRICGMLYLTVASNIYNLKKDTLETQTKKLLSTNMKCQYGY